MTKFLMNAFEATTAIIPFLIIYILLRPTRMGQHRARKAFLLSLVFAIYICGVFYFTGAGTLYDLLRSGIQISDQQLNVVPFSQRVIGPSRALHVVMFMPMGFLLPLGWPAWVPPLYVGAMFLGRFLLYNEMGLARLLYGF